LPSTEPRCFSSRSEPVFRRMAAYNTGSTDRHR
jgi:hypothetical protein